MITDIEEEISQRFLVLQSYQRELNTEQSSNDGGIGAQIQENLYQKLIEDETNSINSLNEQLEFWKAQLDLSNSL